MYDKLREKDKDAELRLYDVRHGDIPPEGFRDAFEWLLSH